ncbi:MAG: GntR family transcriptional regulator [Novosphingobium meiothermophilum]|uniref:GntR family transcriptional regulator n=1 Tax=Novosphingobium TaxID=165696 RepID=UPI001F3567B7|nr:MULTISPECIES: GntR family transcriptional regulator [Novosphingobium]
MTECVPLAKDREPPRYLQLAGDLRRKVLAGGFPAGFPTEAELCAHYGVSRFTVREALRRLQAEGLISRRRGSGTSIQPAAARGRALHQPLSNIGELLQYGRGSQITYRPLGRVDLPGLAVSHLGQTRADEQWIGFSGLRTLPGDPRPLALTEVFFAPRLEAVCARLDLSSGTLFAQLDELAGINVGKVTQDIQAIPAGSEAARLLGLRRGSPVLRVIRCYHDLSGRLFEISVTHHPGDRFVYSMHIDVEG